jgi:hypothetical protein
MTMLLKHNIFVLTELCVGGSNLARPKRALQDIPGSGRKRGKQRKK